MFAIFAIIVCFLSYSSAVNEKCHTRGQRGTCQHIRDCPYAINLIQQNGQPDICEFKGINPLVCCINLKSARRSRKSPRKRPSKEQEFLPIILDNARTPPPRFPNDYRSNSQRFPGNSIDSSKIYFEDELEESSIKFVRTTTSISIRENEENYIPISVKKCLQYYPEPRFPVFVTGGAKSLPKQFPHMALIGFGEERDKQWLCGGSLISKRFILTAGHCLFSIEWGNAKWVHLGDLDLSTDTDDAAPQDFGVKRIIPYPDFKPPQKYHDIALLELDREAELSAYVAPACLQTTKDINDTSMSATGWGQTEFAADSSSFLMQLDLNEKQFKECQRAFGIDDTYLPNGILDDIQICAGGVKGKDTCGGDSGGPLQIKNIFRSFIVKVHTIVGITSFGKACGLTSSPGVYTRVSYYTKWIESIVWTGDQD